MAPSLSAVSTFSTQPQGSTTNTANPSPNPNSDLKAQALGIRPLDMIISDEEVYDELDRRIDEMRGWLDVVGVGLDDLLQMPEMRETADNLVA